MKKMMLLVLLIAASVSYGQKGEVDVVETLSEKLPGQFDPAAYENERAQNYAMLSVERANGMGEIDLMLEPTEEELGRMDDYNCDTCGENSQKMMVGVDLRAGVPVDFAGIGQTARTGVNLPFAAGSVRGLADGGQAWTLSAESIGATAVRVHLTGLDLPAHAALFVYNDLGEVDGPYAGAGPNGNGNLWTAAIGGSVVNIQVRFAPNAERGGNEGSFQIADIAHLGEKFILPAFRDGVHNRAFCSYNAACVVDAACHTGVTAVSGARNGVAHILYSSGSSQYICSGGLLNDTVSSTQIPYFLTANHCISTSSEANSVSFYWQYATSSCGASCFSPYSGAVPSTSGSSILSTSSTSDYTLLQCNQTPPAGSTLLGWTSAAVANSNGTALYRISHPKGAPQAYSQHNVDTSKGTCGSWPRGPWIYSHDITGATEGGSSGSPVLNGSGQVVGQLSGACGTNPSNPCAPNSNATVDGAFANYYATVATWLNPGTTPPCLPSGSSCSSGSQCCSGSCSGWFTTTCN